MIMRQGALISQPIQASTRFQKVLAGSTPLRVDGLAWPAFAVLARPTWTKPGHVGALANYGIACLQLYGVLNEERVSLDCVFIDTMIAATPGGAVAGVSQSYVPWMVSGLGFDFYEIEVAQSGAGSMVVAAWATGRDSGGPRIERDKRLVGLRQEVVAIGAFPFVNGLANPSYLACDPMTIWDRPPSSSGLRSVAVRGCSFFQAMGFAATAGVMQLWDAATPVAPPGRLLWQAPVVAGQSFSVDLPRRTKCDNGLSWGLSQHADSYLAIDGIPLAWVATEFGL